MKKYPPRSWEGECHEGEVPRPIFGIDIDGTLGFYHEHFWAFACAWTGRDLPHPRDYREGSFSQFLGLAKSNYRKIKLAYRRGGAKRSMPVVDGASELTSSLRSRGAVVVLCTTRPYLSLEGIDEDTRHWAKRNKVAHDYIIWGENKYRDLSRFGWRVVSILEDEPPMLWQAMESGLVANRIERTYNQGMLDAHRRPVNGYGCSTLKDAQVAMHEQLDEWEKEHRC